MRKTIIPVIILTMLGCLSLSLSGVKASENNQKYKADLAFCDSIGKVLE